MATVKFRISLFHGQDRIQFDKLMEAMSQAAMFIVDVANDMGLSSEPADWVTSNIEGGSLELDQEYHAEVSEETAAMIERGVRAAWDPAYEDVQIRSQISKESFLAAKVLREEVAPHGELQYGFYKGGASSPSLWVNSLGNIVDAPLADSPSTRKVRYYGEVRGVIEAIFVTSNPPHLRLRDGTSNLQVKCFYNESEHTAVVEAVRKRNTHVIVEGFITKDLESGKVDRIDAVHFHPLPAFDHKLYSQFKASYDDITGGRTSSDLTDLFRGTCDS